MQDKEVLGARGSALGFTPGLARVRGRACASPALGEGETTPVRKLRVCALCIGCQVMRRTQAVRETGAWQPGRDAKRWRERREVRRSGMYHRHGPTPRARCHCVLRYFHTADLQRGSTEGKASPWGWVSAQCAWTWCLGCLTRVVPESCSNTIKFEN